jgi:hypothetical protein
MALRCNSAGFDWGLLGLDTLIEVVAVEDSVPLAEVQADPFAISPWCWILANPRPIKPTPFKGQVSLFTVPPNPVVPLGRARRPAFPINEFRVK